MVVVAATVGGCAASTVHPGIAVHVAHCPVCAYNNDLACETVKVGDATPSVAIDDTTYYFCSEHCRDAFLNDPDAYVAE